MYKQKKKWKKKKYNKLESNKFVINKSKKINEKIYKV